MFLIFLIPNDHVLINYHFFPFVISYFRHFCHFTHLGWLYKPPYKFVTLTLIFQYIHAAFLFLFQFSLFSLLFLSLSRVPNKLSLVCNQINFHSINQSENLARSFLCWLVIFSTSPSLSCIFSLAKHPLMMTNQGVLG